MLESIFEEKKNKHLNEYTKKEVKKLGDEGVWGNGGKI